MIPLRFQAACTFCGHPVDTRAKGVFSLTQGWVKNRTDGGGNAIALPQRMQQWACEPCIDLQRHKYAGLQGALF